MGESTIENGNLAKFAAEEIWQMTSKGSWILAERVLPCMARGYQLSLFGRSRHPLYPIRCKDSFIPIFCFSIVWAHRVIPDGQRQHESAVRWADNEAYVYIAKASTSTFAKSADLLFTSNFAFQYVFRAVIDRSRPTSLVSRRSRFVPRLSIVGFYFRSPWTQPESFA